jgi:predicted nucleotidyltransferase
MLSKDDRDSIVAIAKKYGVSRVLLFGSSALPDREGHDIDLAVQGIKAADFFTFYSDLIFNLSRPVDLIDLSDSSKFHRIVEAEGIPVYG